MGNLLLSEEQTKQTQSISEILQQYKVLSQYSNQEVTVFDNLYNPNLIIELRKFNFVTQEAASKQFKELEKAKTVNHPTILRIYALHSQKVDSFCSSTYQLTVINEHPQMNLSTYLENRGQKDFSEFELWFFLDCIASASVHIQNLKRDPRSLTFEEIYICSSQQQNDNSQIWKIALRELDSIISNQLPLIEKMRHNQVIQNENETYYHIYPSPEEINQSNNQDAYKSSVFSLGMLLLHLAQAESCDKIYKFNKQQSLFDERMLDTRLDELKQKFSYSFQDIIRSMLIVDSESRLDYNGLDEKLNLVPELKGRRITNKVPQIQNYSQNQNIINNYPKPNIQVKNSQSQPSRSDIYFPFPIQSANFQNPSPNFNSKRSSQQEMPVVITESYQNGSRYIGEKLNGLRHGKGKMQFADGKYYDGSWRENDMDGKGILYNERNERIYDGEWKEGKFHNFGHLFNDQAIRLNTPFDYSNFKLLGDYWLTYQGDFWNDKQHGFGVLKLTNGESYTGAFQDNFIHGYGAFTKMDGQIINGYWEYSMFLKIV